MWLLECSDNGFKLTTFRDVPDYAILSHTWGPDDQEVTFKDVVGGTGAEKIGYEKIRFCATQAKRDGLRYFWVDTCCIDKSNNTELATAINSMFRWYQNATRCYVYLSDIEADGRSEPEWEAAFWASKWFTRGWTLQELLAPSSVEFFTKRGRRLGDKKSLEKQINEITGIAVVALRGVDLAQFDVEERFTWAATRQTTQEEDWVYCLLGIFGVFMPLIYGEGKVHAVRRLRKEIAEAANPNDKSRLSSHQAGHPLDPKTSLQLPSASFGHENQGQQVGQSYAPISAEIHLLPERPKVPLQPFATIPFSCDPDFVERGDILDQIRQRCSEPAGRVALVGLGGVGKSQLAIEYAYRVAAEQTDRWIFWIHAGTQARVEEGFRTIANAVKLPGRNQPKADILQLVYGWLSDERNGRWVIVLDSADNSDVFYGAARQTPESKPLAAYLPQSRNGAILVTTRSKDLARRLTGNDANILDVGPMAEADALSLLEKKLAVLPDTDRATELVRVLEYVPLAISQAAGYIRARAPRSSPEKYLDEFRAGERKRIKLLGHDGGDLRRDGSASSAILTTWQISFEHICSRRPSAADLLSLMSFFDRQGIPESLLRGSDGQGGEGDMEPNKAEDLECEDDRSEAEDVFEDDVALLRDYCLVSTNEEGDVFEMHGLVQLSTRKWLEVRGLQEKFKTQFLKRMAISFPTGDYSHWAICRRLFAHVETAMGYRPADGETEEVWARLLYNGGWYVWLQGRYDIAEQMVGKARKTQEKRLGKEDEASLQSIALFALVVKDRGGWKEAESLEVQVMETRKRVLGEEHPSTLTSMANLASTYRNQGRWKEAESLEVQVMETRKRVLGEEHPDTLTSMNNLAFTWKGQGRDVEALALMTDCAQTRQRILGPEHPYTLSSLSAVANWSS